MEINEQIVSVLKYPPNSKLTGFVVKIFLIRKIIGLDIKFEYYALFDNHKP